MQMIVWMALSACTLAAQFLTLSEQDAYVYYLYCPAVLCQASIAFYPLLIVYYHRTLRAMVHRALPCGGDDGDAPLPRRADRRRVADSTVVAERIAAQYFADLQAQWSR